MISSRLSAALASSVFLTTLVSCSKPSVPIEPGVSLALAESRAAMLADINYRLWFDIPADRDGDIAGTADITFGLGDAYGDLQLDFRADPGAVESVLVNGNPSDYRSENEHLVIPAGDLAPGRNRVRIAFVAGSSSLNRNPDYLYTLFVPDRARTAFPLFDQPDLKATYELTLRVPAGWTAMSNAPVASISEDADRREYRFERSDLIPSYLFSFVAGRFETVSRDMGGRTLTMLHRETDASRVQRNVDEIFNLHAASLDWLEEYTGIEYPFRKFGFVLIPAFQYGGMEHVGAILYRASSLFLEEEPTETELLGRAGLIAHETAHMWFGNLVTMKWFDDVWTKEVFANFMAAKIVNPGFPDVDHDLNFLVRHYPGAYSVDRTAGANPIRQSLPNLNEAGQMYGAIIYNKAPIMMRQLEAIIGEEAFKEGMREYLQTFSFANATWPALVDILDRRSEKDLASWSEAWVNTPGRAAIEAQWGTDAEGEGGPFRYGLVPQSITDLDRFDAAGEVERAAMLIRLYEVLLEGERFRPSRYFDRLLAIVGTENNQLVLDQALRQLRRIYWTMLPLPVPQETALLTEAVLREAMQATTEPGLRRMYFDAYADIALSAGALEAVRGAWSGEAPIENLPLSENDRIDLVQTLAIKLPEDADELIAGQLLRTANPDNVRKLEYLAPSLSPDRAVRDRFFASLAEESNRETEPWVLDAVANLQHPLRLPDSERYILPSLELLEEIQVTGDIFFPKRWLDETLGNQRSASAVRIVREFLDERPDYNRQLRMKILQSADSMFRVNRILATGSPEKE